jgi:GYF domain 2
MAAVGLTCANCQNEFETEAAPGQQVVCPACRQFVLVPGAPAELPSWFLSRDGQQYGPYTIAQLQKMVGAGQLQPGDMAWKEGMAGWAEARTIPDLFSVPAADPSLVPVHLATAGQPEYRATGAGMLFRAGGPVGPPFWADLWVLIRRGFAWNLGNVRVLDSENKRLRARGLENETAQKYLVWRRSILLIVAVASFISALIFLITALTRSYTISLSIEDVDLNVAISPFGVFTEVVRVLAQFALPTTAILACVFWARLRLSRRLILIGWLVSFLTPLAIALFPLHWLFNVPHFDTEQQRVAAHAIFGLLGGLAYFVTFTPTVLSLIPGVLRGCVRVKALLPQSVIAGWFLLAGVPLYALLLLVTFITINQLAGNALLIFGILLFMAAPLAYLIGAGLFVRPLAEGKDIRKIGYIQVAYTVLAGVALLLLIIYLFTAEFFGKAIMGFSSATSILLPWNLIEYYIEFAGRSLFTGILVADVLMLMNLSVWHHLSEFQKTEHGQKYDQLMAQLGTALGKS